MKVSLIATILNEGDSIRRLLDSLAAQQRPPDEIVLVDGGSTDDTVAIVTEYMERLPLVLQQAPGCNISAGRNLAIAAAQHPIIAVTDAGVRLPPDWLGKLVAPFTQREGVTVVAGFFVPDYAPQDAFAVAMSATVLPQVEEIDPRSFLPSSRSVAFRKEAWAAVGGYPEWLDYCEDLIFDLRLKTWAGDFVFVPGAAVAFQPRSSLRAFFRQYYLYARGDGKADLWRKRHATRYLTYLGLLPGLAWLMLRYHWAWGLLYALGGGLYLRQPYQRLPRLWAGLDTAGKAQALLWVLLIRVVGDVAKMLGYPVGWRWRWQHQPPDWRENLSKPATSSTMRGERRE